MSQVNVLRLEENDLIVSHLAFRESEQNPTVASAGQSAFLRLIESLKTETQGLPLPETVEIMLEKSGLVAHYKAERDGADRVENLNELVNAAAAFVNEGEEHDLPAFLAPSASAPEHNFARRAAPTPR